MLKSFERISLKPGETKTVSLTLGFNILNQQVKKVVEPRIFNISIEVSSQEKDLQKARHIL